MGYPLIYSIVLTTSAPETESTSSINFAPCSSTMLVLTGGICFSPRRVIRLIEHRSFRRPRSYQPGIGNTKIFVHRWLVDQLRLRQRSPRSQFNLRVAAAIGRHGKSRSSPRNRFLHGSPGRPSNREDPDRPASSPDPWKALFEDADMSVGAKLVVCSCRYQTDVRGSSAASSALAQIQLRASDRTCIRRGSDSATLAFAHRRRLRILDLVGGVHALCANE